MAVMTIEEAIEKVVGRRSLREAEARAVMEQIMSGAATPAQIAALLVALRMKGETGSELTGFAKVMRSRVVPVPTARAPLIDTCGTGGDTFKTFNISTAAAFVAAGAGAIVSKHGNRAVTSRCGSADVLEALGVNLNLSPEACGRLLDEIGIVFLFAPAFHPAMKYAAGPRKEIRLRTAFNLLGPITNPAGAKRQLLGVYEPRLVGRMATVLKRLGADRAAVVHGLIGMDEVSPVGPTLIATVDGRRIEERTYTLEEFGVEAVSVAQIGPGETVEESADILRRAISDPSSPYSQAVLPSAGVAIWVAGLANTFREGVDIARESVRSGAAAAKLEDLVRRSREL
jgi:anthranilate phosphoribosyltransferase